MIFGWPRTLFCLLLPLTPMQQVLIALRFYATGTFQRVIGDLFGVSVFAACTVIHKLLRNKKDNSCHSQRTWPITRESFMMLRAFQM